MWPLLLLLLLLHQQESRAATPGRSKGAGEADSEPGRVMKAGAWLGAGPGA